MDEEWSHYYRQPSLHDLEVLHARFIKHCFSRHAHEYYVVGYIESGVQAYRYRQERHVTTAGEIFLVNPGEPHTGEAASAGGYVYRTVYPGLALMREIAVDVAGRATLPSFSSAVIRDNALAARMVQFHRAVAQRRSSLAIESQLLSALACLIARHAGKQGSPRAVAAPRGATRRAREYVDAHFDTDLSLSQLAALVELSPFHFARTFAQDVGLPVHAYLETVRIRRARELIDRAVPIADVAAAVGYADQSHLTHRFKRLLGITPGQYAREPPAARVCSAGPAPRRRTPACYVRRRE